MAENIASEHANAAYIAACNPAAIRSLLDELDALRAAAVPVVAVQQSQPMTALAANYEQMRIALVGQIHNLCDLGERYAARMVRIDHDEKRYAEGAVDHARKVSDPFNYNGASPPQASVEVEALVASPEPLGVPASPSRASFQPPAAASTAPANANAQEQP